MVTVTLVCLVARVGRCLLTPLSVDTEQLVVFLHRREPVDPVVVGLGQGHKILRDQAGCHIVSQFLERQYAPVAVEQQEPERVRIGLGQCKRLNWLHQ